MSPTRSTVPLGGPTSALRWLCLGLLLVGAASAQRHLPGLQVYESTVRMAVDTRSEQPAVYNGVSSSPFPQVGQALEFQVFAPTAARAGSGAVWPSRIPPTPPEKPSRSRRSGIGPTQSSRPSPARMASSDPPPGSASPEYPPADISSPSGSCPQNWTPVRGLFG